MNINYFLQRNSLKDLLLIFLFIILIVTNLVDLIEDGIDQEDTWIKVLSIIGSVWGVIVLINLIKQRQGEIATLNSLIQDSQNDLALTRLKLKEVGKEYSKYIRKQFELWGLTNSEKEVALIILKGLSFTELAELRNTKVKTVRQQASSIYKKANVTGRHEFSAWFFEDLLT